jgi:hypothetical protein
VDSGVPRGDRWVMRLMERNRGLRKGLWLGLAGERCRAEGNLLLTGEMGSGSAGGLLSLGCEGRASCSSASNAAPASFLRMTCRWSSTRGSGNAGCLRPASTWGGGRCSEQGAAGEFALRATESRSRSNMSSAFRCDMAHLAPWRAPGKDLTPRRESWSPWAAAAEAALSEQAVETALPEHSAHEPEHTARDSCGVGPCRPNGYGGQSCGEQSRRLQTFGERSTNEKQA